MIKDDKTFGPPYRKVIFELDKGNEGRRKQRKP